ncbi:NYN domain-containing protein [Candidatus Gracilibacteria bacterium]|nr:NYN domain-containing protein [Candidatus Gracilibacteria bacterium]
MKQENNIAFIDAQNLHLGTTSENWKVDFSKLKLYLEKKYHVKESYFFLGFIDENQQEMYRKIQKAGFIIEFREHSTHLKGKKKGNVDVDIVFEVMKRLIDDEKDFDKIVLVSGDGDYIKLVKYLIGKNFFKKVLFPNNKYSSLYKQIKTEYRQNLSLIKHKIEYKKERCS